MDIAAAKEVLTDDGNRNYLCHASKRLERRRSKQITDSLRLKNELNSPPDMIPSDCKLRLKFIVLYCMSIIFQKCDKSSTTAKIPWIPRHSKATGVTPSMATHSEAVVPSSSNSTLTDLGRHATTRTNIFCIIKFLLNISEKKNYYYELYRFSCSRIFFTSDCVRAV